MRIDAVKEGSKTKYEEYKKYDKELKRKLDDDKNERIRDNINVTDSREAWSEVREILRIKSANEELTIIVENDREITNPKDIATTMNKNFKEKIDKIKAELNPTMKDPMTWRS